MKIEIKAVQIHERLSEETLCFSASVYVNGHRAFEASNRGCGGCNDYHAYNEQGKKLLQDAEEYCKTLPPLECEGFDFDLEMDLDLYLDELIEAYQWEKKIKSLCKKWIVLDDGIKGEVSIIKQKFNPSFVPTLQEKYPDSKILNLRYK